MPITTCKRKLLYTSIHSNVSFFVSTISKQERKLTGMMNNKSKCHHKPKDVKLKDSKPKESKGDV
jgi:hypothetical protein